MGQITLTYTFSPNTLISSSQMNTNLATDIVATYNDHDTAVNSVHGVSSGAIVGTLMTQTLTNKTLTAPTITSPAISGTVTGGASYTSPTLTTPNLTSPTITGDITLNSGGDLKFYSDTGSTLKAQIDGATGNIGILSGSKVYLDDPDFGGDTFLYEKSSNLAVVATAGVDAIGFSGGYGVGINSGKKWFYDGIAMTGDTYTTHSSSNVLDDYVGGVLQFRRTASKGSFSDTLTVGHDPATGADSGSFSPTLIINAGEANRISTIDFRAIGVQKGVMSYQHNATAANETFTFKVAGITSAFYIDKNGTKITSGTGISPSLFINAPTTSLDSNLSFMAGGVEKGVISYNHNATANLATLDFSVGGSAPLSIGASLLAVTGALTVSSTVGITSVLTASGGFICESGSFCSYVTAAAGNKGVIDISGSTSTGNMSGIKFSTTGGTLSQAFNFAASYYSTGGAAGTLYAKIPTLTAAGTKYMYLYDS